MSRTILKLNASARKSGSVTRDLVEVLLQRFASDGAEVIDRDLLDTPPPYVDEAWIGANFTDAEARSPEQNEALSISEALVAELEAADTYVIGVPIYNFGVPAAFKAWVDQVARARRTFKYTEQGPVGLLEGKTAYVVIASGGTKAGSEIDYTKDYVKHVLGFIGVTDVNFVVADQLMFRSEDALKDAHEAIDAIFA